MHENQANQYRTAQQKHSHISSSNNNPSPEKKKFSRRPLIHQSTQLRKTAPMSDLTVTKRDQSTSGSAFNARSNIIGAQYDFRRARKLHRLYYASFLALARAQAMGYMRGVSQPCGQYIYMRACYRYNET